MDNHFFEAVLNALDEQLALIDGDGQILFVNRSWKQFGEDNGQPRGCLWQGQNYLATCRHAAALGDEDARTVVDGLSAVLAGREPRFHHEYPCHSPEQQRWFILRVTPVETLSERIYAVTHQDITRRKLAEQQAEHYALHDPLTGLANRRQLTEVLTHAWRRSWRSGAPLSLLMVDLDFFKAFNDDFGHQAGDRCLQDVAEVLTQNIQRDTDLVARYGGDEFVLVLRDTDEAGARLVGERILSDIADLALQTLQGTRVTASVGLACRTPEQSPDCGQPEALMALADQALYQAKDSGKSQLVCA